MPSQRQLNRLLKLIADEYAKEGYDLSHMKAVFSKSPRFNNGKPTPRSFMDPDRYGGSWASNNTVYINPNREAVLKSYGLQDADPEEFSRAIMAHELAHEIYNRQATEAAKEAIRKAIKDEKFTTVYLESGIPAHKMDSEAFAEYMSNKVKNRMPDKAKLEASLDYSGSFDDVKAVFDSLPDAQKKRVSPMHWRDWVDSPFTEIREVAPGQEGFIEVYPKDYRHAEKGIGRIAIAVKPEAQGKGVGANMLAKVIDKARRQRFKKLLYRVAKDNEASKALVRKFKSKPDREGKSWEEYDLLNNNDR